MEYIDLKKILIVGIAALSLSACDAIDSLVTAKGQYDDVMNSVSPLDEKEQNEVEAIIEANPELKPLVDQIMADGKVIGVEKDALEEAKRVSDATLNAQ